MFSDPKKNVFEFGFIPGQKVVDMGSGSGHYATALSESLGNMGKIIAVDLSKDILIKLRNDTLRAGRENVEVIDGDISKKNGTKLRDGLADGVVFSNILYQLEDLNGALEEAKRILKPGGKVCIIEWSDFTLLSGKKLEVSKKAVNEEDARKLLEGMGFVYDRSFAAGDHHYGLIEKKPLQ